jgi:hypothetical protein
MSRQNSLLTKNIENHCLEKTQKFIKSSNVPDEIWTIIKGWMRSYTILLLIIKIFNNFLFFYKITIFLIFSYSFHIKLGLRDQKLIWFPSH